MRADASHPDQVREVLGAILEQPEIARNTYLSIRVGRIIGEALGLVEDQHAACERAWGQWLEEQREYGDVVEVPP